MAEAEAALLDVSPQMTLHHHHTQVRGQVVAEAEVALLDVSLRLEELLKLPSAPGSATTTTSGRKPAAGTSASAAIVGRSDAVAANPDDTVDGSLLLLAADGYRELQRFARQMLSRVRR